MNKYNEIELLEYNQLIDAIKADPRDKTATARLRAWKKKRNKKLRKTRKKIKKKHVENRIEYYAKCLERDLPASEKWFREMYLKEDIQRKFSEDLFKDQFNKPFNKRYIPDVCNMGYRYIIEIDGAYHNAVGQKYKDQKRDYYFEKRGYLVLRIRYGSNEDYKAAIEKIRSRVAEIDILETEKRKKLYIDEFSNI